MDKDREENKEQKQTGEEKASKHTATDAFKNQTSKTAQINKQAGITGHGEVETQRCFEGCGWVRGVVGWVGEWPQHHPAEC